MSEESCCGSMSGSEWMDGDDKGVGDARLWKLTCVSDGRRNDSGGENSVNDSGRRLICILGNGKRLTNSTDNSGVDGDI